MDTGELGQFMPQLRALVAVNPESEHIPVVRVNGITSAMAFPGAGGRGGRGGGASQIIAGQAALIHLAGWTWEDMDINRSAAMQIMFPSLGGRRPRRRERGFSRRIGCRRRRDDVHGAEAPIRPGYSEAERFLRRGPAVSERAGS